MTIVENDRITELEERLERAEVLLRQIHSALKCAGGALRVPAEMAAEVEAAARFIDDEFGGEAA